MTVMTIPARRGKAASIARGQVLKVINTHGEQVVDFWAFNAGDMTEFMSMEHTRAHSLHVIPKVGDVLRTNRRRPILTLIEDTSGGIHDTQIAACDPWRYQFLGCTDYHDNCQDNLHAGIEALGLVSAETPAPFNLFMNIPIDAEGGLSFEAPVSKPGDYVLFRAEMDAVVAFSACPQDILPINGKSCTPTEAHFQILAEA
ncbi:MAG: urea carboxylase-associated family protein [Beijerinckiaceae bacterium]|nr:urea carboxylase-associated family protein [Beijerinckiaceae bacterium]